jgi:hypothetical protein
MRIGCKKFDDPFDGEFSRKLVNDAYSDNDIFAEIPNELNRDLYVVESTRELVPPYISNDYHSRDAFVIKKGLVLFHGTIHREDAVFDYPAPGAFFATTPAHSLALLLLEKREYVVNGIPATPTDQAKYDNREASKSYSMNEQEFTDEKWGITRVGSKARLLTYVLKRDLIVVDGPGDSISPKKCASFNYDGLVAGYNRADHWNDNKDLFLNLNELRICKGPLGDYLQLVEEIVISPDDIQNEIYSYIDRSGYYLTQNPTIVINICTDERLYNWSVVSTGLGLLYLYRFLREHDAPLDVLFPIFGFSNVYVCGKAGYVESVITLIDIGGGSMIAKIWVSHEQNMNYVWSFVEFIAKKYTRIKNSLLDSIKPKDLTTGVYTDDSKLILLDGWSDKLRRAGFPVDKYT